MLSQLESLSVLPAKDLERARAYYRDKLGLEPAEEVDGGLLYRMTAGSTILVYETENAGTAKNTALCWETKDIKAEMAELRARGVVFEEYDIPGIKTENGLATTGDELGAWFTDSEGNILCLSQRT